MPKNTRIILPLVSRESAHKIAKAASLSFEYEIYAEYNFLLLSGFILYFVVAFIIYHIDQNIHWILIILFGLNFLEIHEYVSNWFELFLNGSYF